MKKTFLILTSVLGAIAIVIMLTAGGDSKFNSRGYSEYERLLSKAIKQDTELSKQLNKSREVMNATNTSISELNNVLSNLNSYYSSVTTVAETIKDEELKAQILQKINGSKNRFESKQKNANNKTAQIKLLIQELNDLNTAVSIIATLPIQQENEKQIKAETGKVNENKSDLKKQVQKAKTLMD